MTAATKAGTSRRRATTVAGAPPSEPLWYRDAIIYELRVGTFQDSDGDGIGDFRGLTERLDYLQDLGITAVWLLPFYPSPRRDDGYDIADYDDVHPDSGTLEDFRTFLREAHKRGLRVITELVINHTSDQHPWFQRARRAPPGSRWRDFYVWSDTASEYSEARIIFQDFEHSNWSWDPVAKAYYWHRFYSHQPDLNFESPHVRKELLKALDFWLRMGVDGMRLDAIPYLFEREGTNCENLDETHAFLKDLRSHVDSRYADRMLLAEANQWPEDAVTYFGRGDECHMAFHFPVMPRLFMSLQMEDRYPIIDILDQTPAIPDGCQWALFLRNHDELTLEMVTDEERDYMYRVYAHEARARINLGIRRRLAPLLGNDRRRIELMNALLFSLPGTPVLYYGDEIGMGDNIYLGDRNGVRTPMQWSPDRNAGFSRANPQQLCLPVVIDPEYNYETVNVEAQGRNPHSLLQWMKRLIALRRRYKAFGRGSLEVLHPSNHKVLAFIRSYHEDGARRGDPGRREPVPVRRVRRARPLGLPGPGGRRALRRQAPAAHRRAAVSAHPRPALLLLAAPGGAAGRRTRREHATRGSPSRACRLAGGFEALLRGEGREALERVLPAVLPRCRWFGGKSRSIDAVRDRRRDPGSQRRRAGAHPARRGAAGRRRLHLCAARSPSRRGVAPRWCDTRTPTRSSWRSRPRAATAAEPPCSGTRSATRTSAPGCSTASGAGGGCGASRASWWRAAPARSTRCGAPTRSRCSVSCCAPSKATARYATGSD